VSDVVTLADVVKELSAIKRLLAYQVLKQGGQDEVVKALGISQSSVSRMFSPPGKGAKAGRAVVDGRGQP
jgi:hypothetical protein